LQPKLTRTAYGSTPWTPASTSSSPSSSTSADAEIAARWRGSRSSAGDERSAAIARVGRRRPSGSVCCVGESATVG
jgi:hypothetical protein